MMRIIALLCLVPTMFVMGCSVNNDKSDFHGMGLTYQSEVKNLKDGLYYTEVEAAPSAGRVKGATATAIMKASDFCKSQNKLMQEVNKEIDTHLVVNGVARLTFRCV